MRISTESRQGRRNKVSTCFCPSAIQNPTLTRDSSGFANTLGLDNVYYERRLAAVVFPACGARHLHSAARGAEAAAIPFADIPAV